MAGGHFPLVQALAIVLAACALHVSADLYSPASDVVSLTPANFTSQGLAVDGVVLVEFYAPWCGHCKSLTPVWERAAYALKGHVTMAAVNCDQHKELAQMFDVKGFPTLKVFSPSSPSPSEYRGGRDVKSIVEYAINQVKSVALKKAGIKAAAGEEEEKNPEDVSDSVVLTEKNFDELVTESTDVWMVEFYAPWCGHCQRLAPEWKKAAKELKGKVKLGEVDCTTQEALAKRFKVQGFPTIMTFGDDKETPTYYEAERSASAIEMYALEQFALNAPSPLVEELVDQSMLDTCLGARLCMVMFVPHILDSMAEGRYKYLEILRNSAEQNKAKMYRYVWSEAGSYPELESAVGVGGYGYPALVAVNNVTRVYSPYRSSFQVEQISSFLKSPGRDGRANTPLQTLPRLSTHVAWDGQDAKVEDEEEFSLDELMGVEVETPVAAAAASDEL